MTEKMHIALFVFFSPLCCVLRNGHIQDCVPCPPAALPSPVTVWVLPRYYTM